MLPDTQRRHRQLGGGGLHRPHRLARSIIEDGKSSPTEMFVSEMEKQRAKGNAQMRCRGDERAGGRNAAHEKAHKRRFDVHIRALSGFCSAGAGECGPRRVTLRGLANVGSADNSKRLVMRGSCLYG